MTEWIYGKNPVLEALRAGRRKIHRFSYLKNSKKTGQLEEFLGTAVRKGIPTQAVESPWFENRLPGAVTQGWAAEVDPFPYGDPEALLAELATAKKALLLALDQVQDPQNLGSILRSAEATGVNGILLPERHSSPITPAVAKASAGAVEYLKVCHVKNLTRALAQAKEKGFWAVGTSTKESENALDFSWPDKTLLILGSEGKGMRRLVEESCDFLIHLPMAGKISSLNVSASAAVCLFLFQKNGSKV